MKPMQTGKQQILQYLRALPGGAVWVFAVKQAWAALFGGILLIAIVVTNYVHLPWLARYDWLFIMTGFSGSIVGIVTILLAAFGASDFNFIASASDKIRLKEALSKDSFCHLLTPCFSYTFMCSTSIS